MQQPTPPQEPFTKIYLCPECGYWLATNTIMESLAQLAGPVKRICPHDNTELVAVKPEDRLQLRELNVVTDKAVQ